MDNEAVVTLDGGSSGGASAAEPTVQNQNSGASESTPATATANVPKENAPAPVVSSNGKAATFGIHVDPRTGRRSIVAIGGGEAKEDAPEAAAQETKAAESIPPAANQPQTQPQQATVPTAQQQPLVGNLGGSEKVEPYKNAAEIIDALQKGNIDERRIPVEQAFAYAQYKQQAMSSALPNENVQNQSGNNVQAQSEQRTDFYQRVEQMAKERALQEVGLTEEQLATADYTDDDTVAKKASAYEAALMANRNNILWEVQNMQNAKMQQMAQAKAINDSVNQKIAELKQTEPEWDAINLRMATHWQEMLKTESFAAVQPYMELVNAINNNQQITEQQAALLQDYYNKARVAHYAAKNGLGTVPRVAPVPKVEGTPSGDGAGLDQGFDSKAHSLQQRAMQGDYRARRELIGLMMNRHNAKS